MTASFYFQHATQVSYSIDPKTPLILQCPLTLCATTEEKQAINYKNNEYKLNEHP